MNESFDYDQEVQQPETVESSNRTARLTGIDVKIPGWPAQRI